MRQHLINLDYLAEAAALLLGPQGALQLAAVYATIEKVGKAAYERGEQYGEQYGFENGYTAGVVDERASSLRDDATFDPSDYTPVYDTETTGVVSGGVSGLRVITLNEEAHGHHDAHPVPLGETHYDIWHGRFHRPGEAE